MEKNTIYAIGGTIAVVAIVGIAVIYMRKKNISPLSSSSSFSFGGGGGSVEVSWPKL